MREIILYQENNISHAALLEDGDVCEYHVYDAGKSSSLAGAVFKGRVERIVPGMDAAFVHLGLEKNGFLPLKEAPGFAKGNPARPPLQTGQEVLVQVKKDPAGEKGAYLTRDITFPGTYVVFLPLDSFVGVSQRVQKDEDRNALLQLGGEVKLDGTGLVMRSAAMHARPEELCQEIASLNDAWRRVKELYPKKNAPQCLFKSPDPFSELIRDYSAGGIDRIVTNQRNIKAEGIEAALVPDSDLLTVYGVRAQVEKALSRKVWLKSGGYLIFDICEAMTVIDVNTGKFTGGKLLEETIFRLNHEACGEIVRQIRLRNLGGIILIDFIDMQNELHRQAVLDSLQSELKKDRVKTVVHGLTSLGLMECTRKKARQPLYQILTAPCPKCMGSGRIHTRSIPEGDTSNHG